MSASSTRASGCQRMILRSEGRKGRVPELPHGASRRSVNRGRKLRWKSLRSVRISSSTYVLSVRRAQAWCTCPRATRFHRRTAIPGVYRATLSSFSVPSRRLAQVFLICSSFHLRIRRSYILPMRLWHLGPRRPRDAPSRRQPTLHSQPLILPRACRAHRHSLGIRRLVDRR